MERLVLRRKAILTRNKVTGQVLYQQALPLPPLPVLPVQLVQQQQPRMWRRQFLAIRRSLMNSDDKVGHRPSQDQSTWCPHHSNMHIRHRNLWVLDLVLRPRYPKDGLLISILILVNTITFTCRLSLRNGSFPKDPHH